MLRGGSWNNNQNNARAAYRNNNNPDNRNNNQGAISFAELDASVQGWINHVRYGDTWGLRAHLFRQHPV